MATQTDRLRFIAELESKGFVQGTAQMNNALRSFDKRGGNANNVILNLTRGANDARFGFAGLANNLEFVVESFGQLTKQSGGVGRAFKSLGASLLGPIGVVAGISLLIGYGPQIISFFRNAIQGPAGKAKRRIKELREEYQKLTEVELSREEKQINNLTESIEQQKKAIDALQNKTFTRVNQMGQITKYSVELTEEEKLQLDIMKLQLSVDETALQKIKDQIKETKRLRKAKEDSAAAYAQALIKGAVVDQELDELLNPAKYVEEKKDSYANAFADVYTGTFESAFGKITDKIANAKSGVIIKPEDVLVIDEEDFETFGDFGDTGGVLAKKGQTIGEQMGAALKTGIANSISGLSQLIGQTLAGEGNFGDKFLAVIGGFMQALGGAFVAIGIAKTKTDALVAFFGGGPGIIAAGIALGIAGAAISAGASKKALSSSQYGRGSGASSGPQQQVTPTGIQGTGSGGGIVGVVRGDDLRLLNERQSDTYRGRN